jgi:hypothetical protein
MAQKRQFSQASLSDLSMLDTITEVCSYLPRQICISNKISTNFVDRHFSSNSNVVLF